MDKLKNNLPEEKNSSNRTKETPIIPFEFGVIVMGISDVILLPGIACLNQGIVLIAVLLFGSPLLLAILTGDFKKIGTAFIKFFMLQLIFVAVILWTMGSIICRY
jgi:hypothetical protein